jgi:predicted transcriptional regulator
MKEKKEDKYNFTCKLNMDIKHALDRHKEATGIDRTALARRLFFDYLKKEGFLN